MNTPNPLTQLRELIAERDEVLTKVIKENGKLAATNALLSGIIRDVKAFWDEPPTGPGMNSKRKMDLEKIKANINEALK